MLNARGDFGESGIVCELIASILSGWRNTGSWSSPELGRPYCFVHIGVVDWGLQPCN